MKRILILLAFISFLTVKAQEKMVNCKFDYKVFSENQIEDEIKSIYKSQLYWDFSKIELKNITCVIEIVPIKDCINQLDAIKIKPSILISSQDAIFSAKGNKSFNHLELMSKCFKWRVVITDSMLSCVETSDWKYVSFLSQQ